MQNQSFVSTGLFDTDSEARRILPDYELKTPGFYFYRLDIAEQEVCYAKVPLDPTMDVSHPQTLLGRLREARDQFYRLKHVDEEAKRELLMNTKES